jgi:hypothetical protein
MADLQQARAAKARLRSSLSDHAGIRGVGLTKVPDGYCLLVNVARAEDDDIPGAFDGVPVRVRVVGALHPHTVLGARS